MTDSFVKTCWAVEGRRGHKIWKSSYPPVIPDLGWSSCTFAHVHHSCESTAYLNLSHLVRLVPFLGKEQEQSHATPMVVDGSTQDAGTFLHVAVLFDLALFCRLAQDVCKHSLQCEISTQLHLAPSLFAFSDPSSTPTYPCRAVKIRPGPCACA